MKIQLNKNFEKLNSSYLFSEIARKVADFKCKNPSKSIISLGIGDVTLPISSFVAEQMSIAASKMATRERFVGYGDAQGLPSLRKAISNHYQARKVNVGEDEVFINDGAKSDLANFLDVLGDNEIVICDPVYPVYLDASVISGKRTRLLCANEENNFLPSPEKLPKRPFVIYLCSPNNPTGAVFSKQKLAEWVSFAQLSGSLIIFDAAYEAFIRNEALPHSIFEIDGARECAIETCSFSKSAGFTGIRCGWTAIPREMKLHSLWKRRQSTKFNGASYISQVGALASFSPKGTQESARNINHYMKNAQRLASFFKSKSIFFVGGENAPYLWFKIPNERKSWEFFDYLLEKCAVVGTPGVGFGAHGEGFFRFSSFASAVDVENAILRLNDIL